MASTKKKTGNNAKNRTRETKSKPPFEVIVTKCEVCKNDGISEVSCTKEVSGPGVRTYAVTNVFPINRLQVFDLLAREMATFGVTLVSKDGLQKACAALTGKRARLNEAPDFDGLCGEQFFGRDGWEPTREQAESRLEFYGFERGSNAADEDACTPEPDASSAMRWGARQLRMDLSAFTKKFSGEGEPGHGVFREVEIRSYDAFTEEHRPGVTKVKRELWAHQRDGGYVFAQRTFELRSKQDVESLVREMASFGVPLVQHYFLGAACEAMEGRTLNVPFGVDLDQMPPAKEAAVADLSALLPTY